MVDAEVAHAVADGGRLGWFQYDEGVEVDAEGFVTKIDNHELEPEKVYRVASVKDFCRWV